MHELGIAHALVRTATDAARDLGPVRVRAVHLRLGPLAGVVTEALEFAWECAVAGTAIDGAALVVEPVEVRVECDACGHAGPPLDTLRLRCTACNEPTPNVVAGRELLLRALDYDELTAAEATAP